MLKTGRILRLGFLSSALLAGQATSPLIRWEQLRILQQSPGPTKAAYSPDGKRLAIWRRVFENNTQTGCIIEFWDTRSWQIERTIKQQTTNGDVDLVWSPLSTHVAILSGWPSTAITIWDLQSRTVVQKLGGSCSE